MHTMYTKHARSDVILADPRKVVSCQRYGHIRCVCVYIYVLYTVLANPRKVMSCQQYGHKQCVCVNIYGSGQP
jgi:hypothetical protein